MGGIFSVDKGASKYPSSVLMGRRILFTSKLTFTSSLFTSAQDYQQEQNTQQSVVNRIHIVS